VQYYQLKGAVKMETMFDRSATTGEIVVKFPRASNLFKKYKIDFCCGGNRPIGEVLSEKNLNETQVLNELQELYNHAELQGNFTTDWQKISYHQLIDHIVDTHHNYLYKALPELEGFMKKVYRVHGHAHPELEKVNYLFSALKVELEQHMILEENTIFNKIKEYEDNLLRQLLVDIVEFNQSLEEDHQHAGDLLRQIREATNDYTIPEDACTTYKLTYLKLDELESDLFQHIHLENNVLFQRLAEEYQQ
jgi:regulator of cell morphogenesis and NO signaling